MIPEFDFDGELPPGVHIANLEEVKGRFGRFSRTDRRPKLFAKLSELHEAALEFFQYNRTAKPIGIVEVIL